jgi:hypothetical protein
MTYFVKTENNKYMETQNKENKICKISRPTRNIKPIVHINPDIQVLWGMKTDIDINKKIFGGYIESAIVVSSEEKAIEKWIKIVDMAKKICDEKNIKYIDYFPSCSSKNNEEKMIAKLLSHNREAYNSKKKCKIYLKINDLINNTFPKWTKSQFELCLEKWVDAINKAKNICDKKNIQYDTYVPLASSDDPEEMIIGRMLNHYKDNDSKKYREIDIIINKHFKKWLEISKSDIEKRVDKWTKIISIGKQICDAKNTNYENYVPTRYSNNPDETNIATALCYYRYAYIKNKKDTYSDVNLLIHNTFPKWLQIESKLKICFDKWETNISISKKNCDEKNIPYSEYNPSQKSKIQEEKTIGVMLNNYRQAYNGKCKGVAVYPEINDLIKKSVFSHWLPDKKNEQENIKSKEINDIPDSESKETKKYQDQISVNNLDEDDNNINNVLVKKRNSDKQTIFREKLIKLYDGKCVVSSKKRPLEAAHIIPFCENNKFDISNGLLMSCDIHKLFDSFDISINPNTMRIELSQNLLDDNDYNIYRDKKIIIPDKYKDEIKKNLGIHYDNFIKINRSDKNSEKKCIKPKIEQVIKKIKIVKKNA